LIGKANADQDGSEADEGQSPQNAFELREIVEEYLSVMAR
jgi:hypothetical protein